MLRRNESQFLDQTQTIQPTVAYSLSNWIVRMDNQLLTIKFYPPHVHQAMVLRPRLIQRINEGMRRKLTLLSASAGFGKTSLLSQWVTVSAGKDKAVAWLSLDERDNDLTWFWTYLITAIDTAIGGVVGNSLELLHSPRPPSIEAILTSLINNIATINKDFTYLISRGSWQLSGSSLIPRCAKEVDQRFQH
jgi:LuxR family transcriptional regulator, maltose regulon positive regulatory protein